MYYVLTVLWYCTCKQGEAIVWEDGRMHKCRSTTQASSLYLSAGPRNPAPRLGKVDSSARFTVAWRPCTFPVTVPKRTRLKVTELIADERKGGGSPVERAELNRL